MLETANDQTGPRIKQISFFLRNRVGSLLSVVRELETANIGVCAVNILDSADHAVIRMVVDRPAVALTILKEAGHAVFESDVLGVELPARERFGVKKLLSALLLAEVNVHYVYSLIPQCEQRPVLALHVDDIPTAITVLRNHGLTLVGQDEISLDFDSA